MKELIGKYAVRAVFFGLIMTVIGFFRGEAVFTFPPRWSELLMLFAVYSLCYLGVSVVLELLLRKAGKGGKRS